MDDTTMLTPRRKSPITPGTIDYICRDMLGLGEWRPDIGDEEEWCLTMTACGSLLEVAYLIGAYHWMEETAAAVHHAWAPPMSHSVIEVNGVNRNGIWFMEPWCGFGARGGPSAFAMLPQYPVGGYHADFALVTGDDNGSPRWTLTAFVEINGYAVHRRRREHDERRALAIEKCSAVPVLHFFEETDDPLTWFQHVVNFYHGDATG